MSGIQDIINQQLTPDRINLISHSIGADPAATRQAVEAAIPMMMGGMAAHAASPDGSAAIESAAAEHSGMLDGGGGGMTGAGAMTGGLGTVLGELGGMFGGGAAGGILGSILGSNHGDVQDGVTQASGLDRKKVGQLMMILAPIVLGAIARHRSQTGASAGQVSGDLQREAEAHTAHPQFGGMLGSILNKATGQS
ncbi:MAG: DUF937 domain-containing protein [Gemmatimonadales bacterium]